jgi:hypothetical protein
MAETRYSWRPGSRIAIDAMKAGRELDRLERELHRRLTPADVLDRARSANSSLHDHFEWDDSAAAEQYRLSQAGELIRSIEIDVSRSNLSTNTVRAFVSVERQGERSYTSTVHAMSDAELRRQVVQRAWADFDALRKRHQGLTELAAIFAAVDQARPE